MNKERLKEKFTNYERAVFKLQSILELGTEQDYLVDAAIQRFEFTYELAWKILKLLLSHYGISDVNTPRTAFKEAFAAKIIMDGDSWMAMIDDRNLTTHTYDETTALAVYQRIRDIYLDLFVRLKERAAGELK